MAQTEKILAQYQYSWSFLVKNWVLTSRGANWLGSHPTVMQLVLKI